MLILTYKISIALYYLAIQIAATFNPKAKLWIDGRINIFEKLEKLKNIDNIYWFHCASLGEFEQGKPIIEKLKKKDKGIKILITFFSPSGYNFAKNYNYADYVFFLPLDTASNAKNFIKIVKPVKAFFIKYEFWYFFLQELSNEKISTYLISGVFRKDQLFFKWYGSIHKKMLTYFTYFFVQNEQSKILLNNLNYSNVSITGDTRLDRVYENSLAPETPKLIKEFIENKKVIILGSSWLQEEKIITEFINSTKKEFKFIIAPHSIEKKRIKEIEALLENNYIKYSEADYESISNYSVLLIDNIGILANTYQFSDIAFIGGGFSGALHNILEPASFGNVILFGPRHERFHEAKNLIDIKGAYEIRDLDDLIGITNLLLIKDNLKQAQNVNLEYIKSNKGASELILKQLEKQL